MGASFSKKRQYKINIEKIIDTKAEILKTLDAVCRQHGLSYFAFGALLVECVHYADVLNESENKVWDIGLLRNDHERLIKILDHDGEQLGLYLNQYNGSTKYPNELYSVGKICTVEIGDLTIEQPCWIHLSPFDIVPDDFDYFCGFIRQTGRQNRYYNKILKKYVRSRSEIRRYITRACFFNDTPGKAFERRNKLAAQFCNTDNQSICRVVFKKSEVITKQQLFPLQYLPFRDMELPCPADYSAWTTPMTPELVKQTKEIQKVDLFVLKEFDRVCRELGIGYFVCGGTMLGYMRHGGFIPWDDDIDVGMIREDYDRFLREAGPLLDSRCFLQTRQSDPEIPYLFSKIRVNNTEYITKYNEFRNFHKGICLDLFPFDVLPKETAQQKRFLKKTALLVRIHNRFCNKGLPEPQTVSEETTLREKWFHFAGKMQRKLYKSMPLSITQGWYIRHVTKYNHLLDRSGNCEVASFVPTYTHVKTEDLFPYKDGRFEGITIMVPNKPEVFLTMQYGDFMQIPPVHKQNGHTLVRYKADFE